MGLLTTHVLDTSRGSPAKGIIVDLIRFDNSKPVFVGSAETNKDGRCDTPLLEGEAFIRGRYQLIFHAGDYFRRMGNKLPEYAFLDSVVIAFGIDSNDQHYHVPLLLSAYGYSTYRGS